MRCSTLLGDDYERIERELLPTKTAQQLRNRCKNQRNNHRQNVIRQFYAMYSEFVRWEPGVYTQICNAVVTHAVTWQTLQRLYFYFYNDTTLRYYWLYSYFQLVRKMRESRERNPVPLFLTMPHAETMEVPMVQSVPVERMRAGSRGR